MVHSVASFRVNLARFPIPTVPVVSARLDCPSPRATSSMILCYKPPEAGIVHNRFHKVRGIRCHAALQKLYFAEPSVVPFYQPVPRSKAEGQPFLAMLARTRYRSVPRSPARTPHYAGPNVSDMPRFAYIMVFGVSPKLAKEHRVFKWLERREPALQVRKRRWMRRGGVFITAWRRLRRGDLMNWQSAVYWIKRSIHVLRSGS